MTETDRENGTDDSVDKQRIALGIRQPWAELILRGEKTLEVRSSHTQQRGTIYVYASKKPADHPAAAGAIERFGLNVEELPCGLLVGTVEIIASTAATAGDADRSLVSAEHLENRVCWQLANPFRLPEPLVPRFLPYGVWFYPFRRRNAET